MTAVAKRATNLLGPYQLGVGVWDGLEVIIHATLQAIQEREEDFIFFQVDLVNTFNMNDKEKTFKMVEETFHDILEWVLTSYNCEAKLIFGKTIILCQVGFQQGGPLASLLF